MLWKVIIVSHEQENYILICSSRFSILVQHVNFSRQRPESNSNQTKLGNLIVYYIKTVITFSSWIFSHIYDEFCGNLRNHKHIYLFQNWNLDGKNVDFIKPKRKQNANYGKYMSLVCPRFEKLVLLISLPRWLSFYWFIWDWSFNTNFQVSPWPQNFKVSRVREEPLDQAFGVKMYYNKFISSLL